MDELIKAFVNGKFKGYSATGAVIEERKRIITALTEELRKPEYEQFPDDEKIERAVTALGDELEVNPALTAKQLKIRETESFQQDEIREKIALPSIDLNKLLHSKLFRASVVTILITVAYVIIGAVMDDYVTPSAIFPIAFGVLIAFFCVKILISAFKKRAFRFAPTAFATIISLAFALAAYVVYMTVGAGEEMKLVLISIFPAFFIVYKATEKSLLKKSGAFSTLCLTASLFVFPYEALNVLYGDKIKGVSYILIAMGVILLIEIVVTILTKYVIKNK